MRCGSLTINGGLVSYLRMGVAALIVLLTMWVFMGGGEYLYLVYGSIVAPSFYAMVLVVALALGFWLNGGSGDERLAGRETVVWYFCYFLIGVVAIVIFGGNAYSIENLERRLSAFVFVGALTFFVRNKWIKKYVVIGAKLGGVGLTVSVALGFLSIGFVSSVSCRSGGFLVNPNGAAYGMVCAFLISCLWKKEQWRDSALQAFFGVGILLTMSRSGIFAAALGMYFMWRSGQCDVRKVALAGSIFSLILLMASLVLPNFNNNECVEFGLYDRISGYFPVSVSRGIFEKNHGFAGGDASGNERIALAKEAIENFRKNWFLGGGVSPIYGERSHNQLLALLSEHGLWGGGLFLCFWLCAGRSGVPRGVLWVDLFLCMFDHSIFFPRFYLITLVSAFSLSGNREGCLKGALRRL